MLDCRGKAPVEGVIFPQTPGSVPAATAALLPGAVARWARTAYPSGAVAGPLPPILAWEGGRATEQFPDHPSP